MGQRNIHGFVSVRRDGTHVLVWIGDTEARLTREQAWNLSVAVHCCTVPEGEGERSGSLVRYESMTWGGESA